MTPSDFPARPDDTPSYGKVGVLLVALGTPDAPTYGALRRYLAEFLSDPRVIEVPRLIWLPILYGPILTFRPARSARAYSKIWDRERGESPLRTITRDQAEGLQARLQDSGVVVDWAFRYGQPTMRDKLRHMREIGVDRLLVFPLYPHYSATTVASVHDKLFDELKPLRWQPALRTMPPYHDDPTFISHLAQSVRTSLKENEFTPDVIMASYHSIPQSYWDKGDPYPCHCKKTTRLLGEALGFNADQLITTYQSRVGPTKWVGPYTDEMAEKLAKDGVKRLAVLAPAFVADCVETLEEINIELRETFLQAGGEDFHYIPCLNATPSGLDVLETQIRRELMGWIDSLGAA